MPSDDFWSDTPRRPIPRPSRAKPVSQTDIKRPPAATVSSPPVVSDPPRPRLSWIKIGLVAVSMLLGASIGLGIFLYQALSMPANPAAAKPVLFEVSPGQKTQTILANLQRSGLLVSRYPALAYIVTRNLRIRAGIYEVAASQSGKDIIAQLSSGDISEYKVTIPEGWRVEQIGQLLEKAGLVKASDFDAAATYDPTRDTLPPGIHLQPGDSLEGLLFPDTYRIARGMTSKQIIAKMLADFTARTKELQPTDGQIILASLIEREAKYDVDRPKIAGVYTNRLRTNMKLQADPTVTFARDTAAFATASDPADFHWWSPITVADYTSVISDYNTYLHAGLPPGPIANPGLKSLEAAVRPDSNDFYYFLNVPGGATVYSKTEAEHQAAKQQAGI